MNNQITFLGFTTQTKRTAEDRELIGVVQGVGAITGKSSNIYDCFESKKPTYYLDHMGKEVSYIDHAEFIEANSFVSGFQHQRFRFYPMLRYEEQETYNVVHLEILYYERKPFGIPADE